MIAADRPPAWKPSPIRRAADGLSGLAMVMMTAMTGTLAFDVPTPDWFGFVLVGGAFGILILSLAGYTVASRQPEPAGRTARRELVQWRRWQNCLVTWPVVMTNFAFLAAFMARPGHSAGYVFPLMLPVWTVGIMGQIAPARRGEPGSPERRQFDDLADELSREHAAKAFRAGYYAFVAGGGLVIATALFAPRLVLGAAIAAVWLGFVVPSVRFGLLQRAAEGEES
jgi:hypothetical protein